jgi:trans-aconitate methyltransferase
LDDKPYIAPIENPGNIIDLGTGTGLWASLVADRFDGTDRPLATVVGVDLAPQQESSVQPNLEFEVDDITKDWASQTLYDLVHIRLLWGVIDDCPKVYEESFKYASLAAPSLIADIGTGI